MTDPPTVNALLALDRQANEACFSVEGALCQSARSGTSVYVRDGDAWKLAFTLNSLTNERLGAGRRVACSRWPSVAAEAGRHVVEG